MPGDSEKKLAKGLGSGADALIIDLEDAVAESAKPAARGLAAEALKGPRPAELWVRINPLDGPLAMLDLASVVRAAPDGVMLPKAGGPGDVARLSHCLDVLEVREVQGQPSWQR